MNNNEDEFFLAKVYLELEMFRDRIKNQKAIIEQLQALNNIHNKQIDDLHKENNELQKAFNEVLKQKEELKEILYNFKKVKVKLAEGM